MIPYSGTVVDVGCGTGELLDFFLVHRWRKYGVEASSYAKHEASKRGISFDLPYDNEWADLVVMRGVLQHLPDSVGALTDAFKWLKPGGMLAILATPNFKSPYYRRFGTLPALDPPRNHLIWSDALLEFALPGIGFRDLQFNYPYKGTPYAQPVRDRIRWILGRQPFAWPGSMMECFARKPLR